MRSVDIPLDVAWQIGLPGGGTLVVYAWLKPQGLPTGALLSAWASLPSIGINTASGLCTQACSGLPVLPSTKCDDDVCLPVLTTQSIFPAATLSALEALCEMPTSTRVCGGSGVGGSSPSPPPLTGPGIAPVDPDVTFDPCFTAGECDPGTPDQNPQIVAAGWYQGPYKPGQYGSAQAAYDQAVADCLGPYSDKCSQVLKNKNVSSIRHQT